MESKSDREPLGILHCLKGLEKSTIGLEALCSTINNSQNNNITMAQNSCEVVRSGELQ